MLGAMSTLSCEIRALTQQNLFFSHCTAGKRTIFQSIFLDDGQKEHWTDGAIDPDKILKTRMTRQFSHTWTHFAFWVPFVRFIQGRKGTWYSGSYTLFNTHEIAVMSGLAAADRLGADYPFGFDPLAAQQFDMYLKLAHGLFARRRKGGAETSAGIIGAGPPSEASSGKERESDAGKV